MKGSISHFPSIKRISFNIHPVVLLCLIGCASPEDGSPPALTTTTLTHLDSHSPVDATSLPITHLDHSFQTHPFTIILAIYILVEEEGQKERNCQNTASPPGPDHLSNTPPRVDTCCSKSSILNVLHPFVKVLLKKIFPLGVCKVRQSVIFYLLAKSRFFFSSFLYFSVLYFLSFLCFIFFILFIFYIFLFFLSFILLYFFLFVLFFYNFLSVLTCLFSPIFSLFLNLFYLYYLV